MQQIVIDITGKNEEEVASLIFGDLDEQLARGVGIANFSIEGHTFTITLNDGREEGEEQTYEY